MLPLHQEVTFVDITSNKGFISPLEYIGLRVWLLLLVAHSTERI